MGDILLKTGEKWGMVTFLGNGRIRKEACVWIKAAEIGIKLLTFTPQCIIIKSNYCVTEEFAEWNI